MAITKTRILLLTEHNSWERENWSYVLDFNKQDSQTLNLLMTFLKVINSLYEVARDGANIERDVFGRSLKIFAASRYRIEFWDSCEVLDKKRIILKTGNRTLSLNAESSGYKANGNMCLNKVISLRKLQGALADLRKSDSNRLYKNVEYLFLK